MNGVMVPPPGLGDAMQAAFGEMVRSVIREELKPVLDELAYYRKMVEDAKSNGGMVAKMLFPKG